MVITEDKKGNKTARLSRFEQGALAWMNIESMKIQNMRKAGLPPQEIIKAELALARERRGFMT